MNLLVPVAGEIIRRLPGEGDLMLRIDGGETAKFGGRRAGIGLEQEHGRPANEVDAVGVQIGRRGG